ncbi:MAG: hypothetical protein JXX29_01300 [Deltaproteobacteria bacterium]|nr:hypothetical protein [Deltaproteobacteria bacterium]MBN2670275.1 hypothetical protein [Deltaproteobacteria bacterium]
MHLFIRLFSVCCATVLTFAGCDSENEDNVDAFCIDYHAIMVEGDCTGSTQENYLTYCRTQMNDEDCGSVFRDALQCDIDNNEVCVEYSDKCSGEWNEWILCG